MPRRVLPGVEILLEKLAEGKSQKEIGSEYGAGRFGVDYRLRKHVRETGCRTLIEAVVRYVKTKAL